MGYLSVVRNFSESLFKIVVLKSPVYLAFVMEFPLLLRDLLLEMKEPLCFDKVLVMLRAPELDTPGAH